jgi:hypothetical protein
LESRTSILEKQRQNLRFAQPGPYIPLSSSELIDHLKRLIKKANSIEGLDPKPAREILLEDRR